MDKSIDIEVTATVSISRETVDRALQVVNWYLKDHPEIVPLVRRATKQSETYHKITF